MIAAKHKALVVVSGYNFRLPSGSIPCAAPYTRLRLIPPSLTRRLEIGLQYLPDCGPLDVSPVLPPSDVA